MTMTSAQRMQRYIQEYLDGGGATMDEGAYQDYKRRLLDDWLLRYFHISRYAFRCRHEGCLWVCDTSVGEDAALAHLKTHRPELFMSDGAYNYDLGKRHTRLERKKAARKTKGAQDEK